jgi:uncharacterized coiled-coil protein SlyX
VPDDIDERLRAVERALTDGETPVADLSDTAAVHERLDSLEARLEELAHRVDALDATVQSLHGYVGELEAVNDRVERRADAARAAVERLEDERRHSPEPGTERRQSGEAENDGGLGEQGHAPDDAQTTGNPFDEGAQYDATRDRLSKALGDGDDTRNAGCRRDVRGEGDTEGGGESLLERVRESL